MVQPSSPGSVSAAFGFLGEQLLLVKHLAQMSAVADSLAFTTGWHENVAEQHSCPGTQLLAALLCPALSRSFAHAREALFKLLFHIYSSLQSSSLLSSSLTLVVVLLLGKATALSRSSQSKYGFGPQQGEVFGLA